MFRHIFLGTAKEGISQEQLDELVKAWSDLPSQVTEVRSLTAGRNVSQSDGKYSVALVADFDDVESWQRYAEHPAHKAVSQTYTSKVIEPASKTIVQLNL